MKNIGDKVKLIPFICFELLSPQDFQEENIVLTKRSEFYFGLTMYCDNYEKERIKKEVEFADKKGLFTLRIEVVYSGSPCFNFLLSSLKGFRIVYDECDKYIKYSKCYECKEYTDKCYFLRETILKEDLEGYKRFMLPDLSILLEGDVENYISHLFDLRLYNDIDIFKFLINDIEEMSRI